MDDLRGEETTRETGELAKEQQVVAEEEEEEEQVFVVVLGRKGELFGERFIEREERFIVLLFLSLQE